MLGFLALATVQAMSPDEAYSRFIENMPPDAPASYEVPIDAVTNLIVRRCVDDAESIIRETDGVVVRFVITTSEKHGEVWRADGASRDHPPILSRYVCSRDGALIRPLEMFDPTQSIPPLPD